MKILLAGGLAAALLLTTRADAKPNVVLIMADDLGYECVGVNGSEFYSTPNLDRLAAEGMRFTHAYSQPLCTPSRVKLMTGRSNARNYVKFGLLHPKETTFANMAQDAGYATCIAGKWQLKGGHGGPGKFGFDEYCLWQIDSVPRRYTNPGLETQGKRVNYTNGQYGPDIVSDHLVDFIQRKKDEPFFAYYPMILPHWPFQPTPDSDDWDPQDNTVLKRGQWKRRHYRDMVAYMDKMVGKIDQALRDAGVRDNTLLLFTSDNGTDWSITSPYKGQQVTGGKRTTLDTGTHTTLIANWPGVTKPGAVCDDLVDFSDVLPTLADLTGGNAPTDRPLDGRSFLPQIKGQPGNPRDWVYCWYERNARRPKFIKRFARTKRYKLYHDGRFYDLSTDKMEEHPIAVDDLEAQAQAAHAKLLKVHEQMRVAEEGYAYGKQRAG